MADSVVDIEHLTHRYGARTAVRDVSLEVYAGELFGLLGPNGGGKTTLFRILSALVTPTNGGASVYGHDTVVEPDRVRERLGFVFQHAALDEALTVNENLEFHGALYGLSGQPLRARISDLLGLFGLSDRADERVKYLSGGLARRVDLARGLLHAPSLLLLDEPTTGLDPGARRAFWEALERLRLEEDTTVMVATHLMEEAAQCGRVGIIDRGQMVALGAPDALTRELGETMIWLHSSDPDDLRDRIEAQFGLGARVVGGRVQVGHDDAPSLLAGLYEAFGDRIESSAIRHPSLEDVFLARTGYRLDSSEPMSTFHD